MGREMKFRGEIYSVQLLNKALSQEEISNYSESDNVYLITYSVPQLVVKRKTLLQKLKNKRPTVVETIETVSHKVALSREQLETVENALKLLGVKDLVITQLQGNVLKLNPKLTNFWID